MPPQPPRRAQLIIWVAMVLSIPLYFVVATLVPPSNPQPVSAARNFLFIVAPVLVAISFPMRLLFERRIGAFQGTLIALVFCEAAALCGIIVWFVTGWPFYYVLLLFGLVGGLLHYPKTKSVV